MKQNSKLALILVGASVLGSATTILATSAFKHANNFSDTYIPSSEQEQNNGFIRTAARVPSIDTDFTVAAEKSINAVVSVKPFATPKAQPQSNGFFMDPFEFFFGPNNGGSQRRQQQQQNSESLKPQQLGLGSGVIISADGYIVTNNHVINGAEKVEITLNDNRSFNAKIIGSDATSDLALLKIEAENLPVIVFGDSDAIKIGEWVLAVGNPFGFTSTVTAGIVSAKARSISQATHGRSMGIESFIQTDAAVNPGNSGGALVNTNGELVGINTAIYSQTGNYAGYSFAIPSALVKKIIEDIKQYGTVQRAVLGISFTELTAEMAEEKKITATNDGIYVAKVVDRSAAMEAGLKEGDVIVKINGNDVKNNGQMMEQMNKLRPGDVAVFTYIRDNKTQTTKVTLKNNQGNTSITKTSDVIDLGCSFKKLSAALKKELQISNGVEVVGLKSGKFKNAGIKEGFVITDINNVPVTSQEDVENIYNSIMKSTESDKVMFITGYYPTGAKKYYAVDLAD
ncbi:MAG: Do family serine endopeptidase [Muribaculaceae bacterium]